MQPNFEVAMEYQKINNNSHSQKGDDNLALKSSPTDEITDIGVFVNEDKCVDDFGLTFNEEDVVIFGPFMEYLKFLLSCFYCAIIMLGQAFSMVYVTNRVYSIRNETQLPDLILDNVRQFPWALQACEYCMVVLFCIWLLIVIFHQHRIVLLRRQYYIQGNMYLMRIITTIVTGLPLINDHKRFAMTPRSTFQSFVERVFQIMATGSMQITARNEEILSYGDYIFSGHIMLSTLLTALICKYSPKSFWWLRLLVFVLNITASIFMVLDHGHYTIDVILAWFLTSFYFCLYHILVDFKAFDEYKPPLIYALFFPFYQCFESSNDRYLNAYESPSVFLKRAKKVKSILKDKLC